MAIPTLSVALKARGLAGRKQSQYRRQLEAASSIEHIRHS